MTHADVYAVVSRFVPTSHMEWPNDSAPALPWALYSGESRPVGADNMQIAVRHEWTVDLYEKRRDKNLEKALGDALRERFGQVTRRENYIENDNMLEVSYTFGQLEGETDG